MIHKFKVEPFDDGIHAKVFVDEKPIRCIGYTISHSVDCFPSVELQLCVIPEIENYATVQISNKEEIALDMDYNEFQEFCRIWNEVH